MVRFRQDKIYNFNPSKVLHGAIRTQKLSFHISFGRTFRTDLTENRTYEQIQSSTRMSMMGNANQKNQSISNGSRRNIRYEDVGLITSNRRGNRYTPIHTHFALHERVLRLKSALRRSSSSWSGIEMMIISALENGPWPLRGESWNSRNDLTDRGLGSIVRKRSIGIIISSFYRWAAGC